LDSKTKRVVKKVKYLFFAEAGALIGILSPSPPTTTHTHHEEMAPTTLSFGSEMTQTVSLVGASALPLLVLFLLLSLQLLLKFRRAALGRGIVKPSPLPRAPARPPTKVARVHYLNNISIFLRPLVE
jgi:hypothetical protein